MRNRSGLLALGAIVVAMVIASGGGCVDSKRAVPPDGGADGAVGAAGDAADTTAPPTPDVTVAVDPAVRHQTMVGFGASLAYYASFVADRQVVGDDLDQVLFSDLGMDVLRLGNWYQNQSETGTSESTPFTDTAATIVVQRATAALGHAPRIIMSSWTPPAYLKSNAETKNGGTLGQAAAGGYDYAGFARWWVGTLSAYAARGVAVDYVSIQNEPELSTSYESCLFDAMEGGHAGYPQALGAVAAAIAGSALTVKPKLIGPETLGIPTFGHYIPDLNANDVAGIAHHNYGTVLGDDPSPDAFINAMTLAAQAAASVDKPLFMTEFAPNLPSMLNTAWLIHNAVTVEGVSVYLYWALAWAPGTPVNWLVTVEDPGTVFKTPKGYTINDPYYALKHYARWVDEGWVRVDATSSLPSVKSSAFASPDGGQLTVVVINTDATAHTIAVAPTGFAPTTVAAYRSAGSVERTAAVAVDIAAPAVAMPAQSIVTVTLLSSMR
jgi:glucuronoarabinoxylan endo-1,4-beta-xylanase